MAETIIGTGRQQSVRNILGMIEKHLMRTEGTPRLIQGKGDGIEFVAEREDFKGEFDSFLLNLRVSERRQEAVRKVAEKNAKHCEVKTESGAMSVRCPKEGGKADSETLEVFDNLCACLNLPEIWRVTGDKYRLDRISSELVFQALLQYKASDVHLTPGQPPIFRVDGDTRGSDLMGPLSGTQIRTFIRELAGDTYWAEFERFKQTSFNFHQVGLGYARVSAFIKSDAPHCTMRFLPEKIPSFEELHVPRGPLESLAALHRGLLLVTGMTGSGKSTTVAALVDWINSNTSEHILCIENPIEYVHENKKCIVSQRTLGVDVDSFNDAVTGALRHDPDVIVIGEMRDPDTIRSAINAAATGHLVISTLHANTASEVVNRVVSFFDPVERDLVKLQLRDCLQCVICQRLVPRVGGGRIPALEILFSDVKAIKDGIMGGDTDMIRIGMQQTVSHSFIFEQYLHQLYKKRDVSIERAREFSTDASIFDQINMGTYSVPRLDSIKHH